MNGYYHPYHEETSNSFHTQDNSFHDSDQWRNSNTCYCLECCDESSYPHVASCQNLYCNCENCQNTFSRQYATLESDYDYSPFTRKSDELNFSESAHLNDYEEGSYCTCGNCNLPLSQNSEQYPNFIDDQGIQAYTIRCQAPCDCIDKTRYFCGHTYDELNHSICQAKTINDMHFCSKKQTQPQSYHCSDLNNTRKKSTSSIPNKSASSASGTLESESFYSCNQCDPSKIQMVYTNKKQIFSKSSVEGSSSANSTKKKYFKKRHNKRTNAGYYKIASPTFLPESSQRTLLNEYEIPGNIRCRQIHYGYFEVKQKDYQTNTENQKKISLLELDNVPIKINKQIDTRHFKESTTLDKSLSANIARSKTKMSNKSLTVNLDSETQQKVLTQSEVLKMFNQTSKEHLQITRSNKVIQPNASRKYHIELKLVPSDKLSIAKQRSSFDTKLKAVKSLSEGSVSITSSSKLNDIKSKEIVTIKNKDYKNYFDKRLQNLENNISSKINEVLTSYRELPKKKPTVTVYQSLTENTSKPKQERDYVKQVSEFENSPSSLRIIENIIDSAELETNSQILEDRPSNSSPPNIENAKIYNNNISSVETNPNEIFQITDAAYLDQTPEKGNSRNKSLSSEKSRRPGCSQEPLNSPEKTKQSKSTQNSGISKHSDSAASTRKSSTFSKLLQSASSSVNKISSFAARKPSLSKSDARKSHDSSKNIRFNNVQLDTIEEESEPHPDNSLRLIHECDSQAKVSEMNRVFDNASEADMWSDGDELSNKSIGRLARANTHYDFENIKSQLEDASWQPSRIINHVPTSENISQKSKNSIMKHDSNLSRNSVYGNSNSKPYGSEYNYRYAMDEQVMYDYWLPGDCCLNQTCGDCPKMRYFAPFLPHQQGFNNSRQRMRFTNSARQYDKLADYALQVPLYSQAVRSSEQDFHRTTGQNKFLNIVSFIVFIVLFSGIVQYICAGINSGTFP